MNIILLGSPSSGKGTQGELISKTLNIPHISSGNLIRQHIENKTKLGQKVKEIINRGNLVPDKVINKIVLSRLKESDCKNGFILDGYPRTLAQAETLENNYDIDYVININIDEQIAIQRVSGRMVCNNCNKTYHTSSLSSEHCPICNRQLEKRSDDREDIIKNRYKIYFKQTKCLTDYYSLKHILHNVDGHDDIPKITNNILKILGVSDDNNQN